MSHSLPFELSSNPSHQDVVRAFDRLADLLLNERLLHTPKAEYRLREIEFYYYALCHKDLYCHCHPHQRFPFRYYFHRFKNADKYANLKQKGLDIVFSNKEDEFAGVLLRTIENLQTKTLVTGVARIADKLMDEIGGANEIKSMYEATSYQNTVLRLSTVSLPRLAIYKQKRKGLNLKSGDHLDYLNSKYNYFTYPEIEQVV